MLKSALSTGGGARKVVRPPGLFALPLEVLDGGRYPVATVSAGRRRFAIRDTCGRPLGTIGKAKRGYRVDYTIQDAAGLEVGTIS